MALLAAGTEAGVVPLQANAWDYECPGQGFHRAGRELGTNTSPPSIVFTAVSMRWTA